MYVDVIKVRDWYFTALGRSVESVLCNKVSDLCQNVDKQQQILFLGYGLPFTKLWSEPNIIAAMPGQMGVIHWPSAGPNSSCLVWEGELPFPDNFFDKIVISHLLEFTSDVEATIQECHRVLRPNGQLVAFAPNRTGVWSRREVSPFAMGMPFSCGQLEGALNDADFMVMGSGTCLFIPPSRRHWILKWAQTAERIGQTLNLPFGGVVWCDARKDVLGGRAVRVENSMKRARPVLAPTT